MQLKLKLKDKDERATERLRFTNMTLNYAQYQLNLTLLDQAAASDDVIATQDASQRPPPNSPLLMQPSKLLKISSEKLKQISSLPEKIC